MHALARTRSAVTLHKFLNALRLFDCTEAVHGVLPLLRAHPNIFTQGTPPSKARAGHEAESRNPQRVMDALGGSKNKAGHMGVRERQ